MSARSSDRQPRRPGDGPARSTAAEHRVTSRPAARFDVVNVGLPVSVTAWMVPCSVDMSRFTVPVVLERRADRASRWRSTNGSSGVGVVPDSNLCGRCNRQASRRHRARGQFIGVRFVVAGMLMVLRMPKTAFQPAGYADGDPRWRRSRLPHGTLRRHPVADAVRQRHLSAGRTGRGSALRLPEPASTTLASCRRPVRLRLVRLPPVGHRRSWRHPRRPVGVAVGIEHVEQRRELAYLLVGHLRGVRHERCHRQACRCRLRCPLTGGDPVDARVTHCRHLRVLGAVRR